MADWVLDMAPFLVMFVVGLAIPGMIVADHEVAAKLRRHAVPRKSRRRRRQARRIR